MRVKIKNLTEFEDHVFGANCFLRWYPQLQSDAGVELKCVNNLYYVINPPDGRLSDSALFTTQELSYLETIGDTQ